MTEPQTTCPSCGASFPTGGAARGACPRCLLEFAFGETVVAGGATGAPANATGTAAAAAAPAGDDLPPESQFGPYRIEGLLGRGGMGVVYRALQPALGRTVALKVLPAALARDPHFTERFQREARALAALAHPNIVGLYDYGCLDGRYYFTMEYVDGASLRKVLEAGKLAPARALEVVPQLCDALQYAHRQGVVHRDIKPENILIDREGRVKIADFGLAKVVGGDGPGQERITRTNVLMGTAHYMAPEQVERPKEVDHRADIYSLGVVFYEMLTGELPLGRFEPPSRKVEVSVKLDEVVLKALEKSPERRYQQASEVKEATTRYGSLPAARGTPLAGVIPLAIGLLVFAAAVCIALAEDLAYRQAGHPDAQLMAVLLLAAGAMACGGIGARQGRKTAGRAVVAAGCLLVLTGLGLWIRVTVGTAVAKGIELPGLRESLVPLVDAKLRQELAAKKDATAAKLAALARQLKPDDPARQLAVLEYDGIERMLADLEKRPPQPWREGAAVTTPAGPPPAGPAAAADDLVRHLREWGPDSVAYWTIVWELRHDDPQRFRTVFAAVHDADAGAVDRIEKTHDRAQEVLARFMTSWSEWTHNEVERTMMSGMEKQVKEVGLPLVPAFVMVLEDDPVAAFSRITKDPFESVWTREMTARDQVKALFALGWLKRQEAVPVIARHLKGPSLTANTAATFALQEITGQKFAKDGEYFVSAETRDKATRWWQENRYNYVRRPDGK